MAMTSDIPAADRMWAAQLRARHGDVITRYVARRIPANAGKVEAITDHVFYDAAANRAQITGWPLPWLIANARGRCAEIRLRRRRTRSVTARRAS